MTLEKLHNAQRLRDNINGLKRALAELKKEDNIFASFSVSYKLKTDTRIGGVTNSITLPESLNEKFIPILEEELNWLENEFKEL